MHGYLVRQLPGTIHGRNSTNHRMWIVVHVTIGRSEVAETVQDRYLAYGVTLYGGCGMRQVLSHRTHLPWSHSQAHPETPKRPPKRSPKTLEPTSAMKTLTGQETLGAVPSDWSMSHWSPWPVTKIADLYSSGFLILRQPSLSLLSIKSLFGGLHRLSLVHSPALCRCRSLPKLPLVFNFRSISPCHNDCGTYGMRHLHRAHARGRVNTTIS